MLKKYLEYLKNNPGHYWFKRKIWGWGWVPVTWQGWLVTFVYILLVFLLVISREEAVPGNPDSGSNFLVFGLPFIVLTALFIFIAYKKGESPKWQWGIPKDEQLSNNTSNHMEKLTFTTIINTPREKVWNTMLDKDTYQEWTVPFHEGSTYEGDWEEGSEIKFLGPDEDGKMSGMYALIAAKRPYEFVSIKHLGEIDTNGEKKPWPTTEGQEGYENYTFKDVEGGTEVIVELTVPSEWKDMFNDMWPKALAKLKEIAEKQ